MDKEPKFKYQKQIDDLLAKGCQLPELNSQNFLLQIICRHVASHFLKKDIRIMCPNI